MNKVKSIVTGGAGFIGSHLVDSLVQLNHEVIVLDNLKNGKKSNLKKSIKKIKIIKCELSKYGKWVDVFKEVDYVFHLAGLADIVPSITHPTKYFQSNVNATLNVLRASSKIKIFGSRDNLPNKILNLIQHCEDRTKNNNNWTLSRWQKCKVTK